MNAVFKPIPRPPSRMTPKQRWAAWLSRRLWRAEQGLERIAGWLTSRLRRWQSRLDDVADDGFRWHTSAHVDPTTVNDIIREEMGQVGWLEGEDAS